MDDAVADQAVVQACVQTMHGGANQADETRNSEGRGQAGLGRTVGLGWDAPSNSFSTFFRQSSIASTTVPL